MQPKKESVFVFILFLFFFPVYAVFNNALVFLFDQVVTNGELSKLFNYNFTGDLIGCLAYAKLDEFQKTHSLPITNSLISIAFIVSLISWFVIFKTKTYKLSIYKWSLIFLFSFFLYTSLEFLYGIAINFNKLDSAYFKRQYLITLLSIITVMLALFIFFKRLNKTEKWHIFVMVIPASFISALTWIGYIGPKVLPI